MQRSPSVPKSPPFPQALDKLAILAMVIIAIIIGIVLFKGDRIAPRVRDFNWNNKQVGVDDTAFVLTFSRPMDHTSVEKNLKIEPSLPGRASWAGRRMAYTLNAPAPYGMKYKVALKDAVDYFSQEGINQSPLQPFESSFRTRDRAFAYIGVQGEEEGRLVLVNITTQEKTILTPPDLIVNEFESYPLGDRILFAATSRSGQSQGLLDQKLYRVSTGLQVNPPQPLDPQEKVVLPVAQEAKTLELLLDSNSYQNLKFDLSTDGNIIVIQRVNRNDPADFGPWIVREGKAPEPLKGQPGGDFLITPDSESLAIAQGQGLAILPLEPNAEPLDFLPKFGIVLNFSRDGSLAAMVKFNSDRTRSLFLVTNQGTQQELLKTQGSIFSAQFDPTKQVLYCLLSELIPGDTYQEKPFLAVIDLKTKKLTPLLSLPNQRDVQVSLSPDGLAVLYDQTIEGENQNPEALRNRGGKAIADSRLWILPLDPKNMSNVQPEPLPISGLRPRWLP